MEKVRAGRNRTLIVSHEEAELLAKCVDKLQGQTDKIAIVNKIYCNHLEEVVGLLPEGFVDLMIIDPPYNLNKNFHGLKFSRCSDEDYYSYIEAWFSGLLRLLKKDASIYFCCDWRSSGTVQRLLDKYCIVRNRITWQREKGRAAHNNWKNSMEDIWFATMSDEWHFSAQAVQHKRRVIAPYRADGQARDWQQEESGRYRLTAAGNLWDDITVPFWSMRENTDHPTQKPEKLIAKLILASSRPGDMVFDPFLGSGTTAVVAKKLGRHYCGVEANEQYCTWIAKRLALADTDDKIQGYYDGIFWERNSQPVNNERR